MHCNSSGLVLQVIFLERYVLDIKQFLFWLFQSSVSVFHFHCFQMPQMYSFEYKNHQRKTIQQWQGHSIQRYICKSVKQKKWRSTYRNEAGLAIWRISNGIESQRKGGWLIIRQRIDMCSFPASQVWEHVITAHVLSTRGKNWWQ